MEVIPVFADPLSFGACFVVGMFEQNDLIPPCVAGCVVLASMLGLYYLVGHEVDVVFRSFCVRNLVIQVQVMSRVVGICPPTTEVGGHERKLACLPECMNVGADNASYSSSLEV
jgi:hypothetical protein